jgi:hypothetical protein
MELKMYKARKIRDIKTSPGCWNYQDIGIFNTEKNIQIGSFVRNYNDEVPFSAFKNNDKWYAVYSKHYTCTQVMELPSCDNIGGEKPDGFGFCPVELYVPDKANGKFGFVCGCVWGLDSGGWYLQYLDLTDPKKMKRIDKYKGLQIPDVTLKEYVDENFDTLSKEDITDEDIKKLPKYIWDDEDSE